MSAKIPAHVREQQINALPNISFVRWAYTYKNKNSKAICRCAIDGHEWGASVHNLVNGGWGCPQCGAASRGAKRRAPADARAAQINAKPNISFVRWDGTYKNNKSKAICRCALDGFEWAGSVGDLIHKGSGCPQCAGQRRWTAGERIAQINAKPNISFVRWDAPYKDNNSKAICRCSIDGLEWAATVDSLVNTGSGCPQCGGTLRVIAEERIAQINAKPNISFVRWVGEYRSSESKAVCRCDVDGYEWAATVSNLVINDSGCPACAKGGYSPAAPGTLYALRSECGSMVKIGISNSYKKRHAQLKRATPFDWHCIELVHGEGARIAELEQELLGKTEPIDFGEQFDGYTEWRKWDARIPEWFRAASA